MKRSNLLRCFIFVTITVFFSAAVSNLFSQTTQYPNSPFGIHDPTIPEVDKVEDIIAVGAKCVRYAGADGIVWDANEPQKGIFQWGRQDWLYSDTFNKGIKMFVSTISASNAYGVEHGRLPNDMNSYRSFLRKAVERYDGDGIDDAPGSPVVDVWQIENEPDIFWKDSPEDYAVLLKESYKVIKEANPNALVAIGGVGAPAGFLGNRDFYIRILNKLNSLKESDQDRFFDVFDFHWYPFATDYNYLVDISPLGTTTYYFNDYVNSIKQTLARYGYNNIPIYITETGQYTDKPATPSNFEYHSEIRQALFLLKLYIYSIAKGVSKIYWATLTEWHNFGNDPNGVFDNVGLIHNPANDGKSFKKLSYFTYKKMVEQLEGADWNNVSTLQDSNGIYIIKFTLQGRRIWAVWNDTPSGNASITISGINTSKVLVTEALPKFTSGDDVTSYTDAFRKDTFKIINSNVTLTAREMPLFIEEMILSSVDEHKNSEEKEFELKQNYPNPFNSSTSISFSLPKRSHVTLKIYDVLGRIIATLLDKELNLGEHSVVYNSKNVASGVYFFRLSSPSFSQTKSMNVLK